MNQVQNNGIPVWANLEDSPHASRVNKGPCLSDEILYQHILRVVGGITSFNTRDGRRNVVDDDISRVTVDLFPVESNENLI